MKDKNISNNLNEVKIKVLTQLLEKHTGKKVILKEMAGRVKATLTTMEQIKNYVRSRISQYKGSVNGFSYTVHGNTLLAKDDSVTHSTGTVVKVGQDLVGNGFKRLKDKKINNKTYMVLKSENSFVVLLPLE